MDTSEVCAERSEILNGVMIFAAKRESFMVNFSYDQLLKFDNFLRLTSKCLFRIFKERCPVSRDPHKISKFHEVKKKKLNFKYEQEWERSTEFQNKK